eukprot:m.96634 g.96634  ORF g.96634 m.96634 type:complete len:439 (+) comp8969_c0_seq3:195-1511(+)
MNLLNVLLVIVCALSITWLVPISPSLALSSKELQALWKAAVTKHQQSDFEGAIKLYLRISKEQPLLTQAYTNAAALLIHEGNEEQAIVLLQEALKHNPTDYMANLNLAIILSESADHSILDHALKCAKQATISRPSSQAAFHVLGNIYQSQGIPHLAESALRTATNIKIETRSVLLPRVFPEKNSGLVKFAEEITSNKSGIGKRRSPSKEDSPPKSVVTRQKDYHIVSIHPLIVHIPSFFSEKEADAIVDTARHSILKKSETYANNARGVLRSSETAWIRGEHSTSALRRLLPFLRYFGRNGTLDETGVSVEPLQAVHYSVGGFYHAHHDSTPWHPRDVTALYYLSEINGGKTIFPNICELSRQTEEMCLFRSVEELDRIDVDQVCNDIEPPALVHKGDAILFFNTLPDGEPDPHSAHVACPVTQGEKWLANHWITGI